MDPSKSRTRAWLKGDKFNKFMTGRRWGWQRFILREDLMNPANGYIGKDGTVIFEAKLDVFVKKTVTLLIDKEFEFNLYPIPKAQMNTDFRYFFNNGNINPNGNTSSGSLADVAFLFEENNVQHAHTQILAARSPVFCKLFASTFAENSKYKRMVEIKIHDIPYRTFVELLRYIYTGDVQWPDESKHMPINENNKRPVVGVALDEATSLDHIKKRRTRQDYLFRMNELPHSAAMQYDAGFDNYEDKELLHEPKSVDSSLDEVSGNEVVDQSNNVSQQSLYSKAQMQHLRFALSLYEAADKYELNRLRLLAEHKTLEILKSQINRINKQVQVGHKYWPRKLSRVPLIRQEAMLFRPSFLPNKNDMEEKQKDWCNGFLDVLVVAYRHNSKRLKRICLTALTSEILSKRTKKILLSSELLYDLSKDLITEMLQYVAVQEQKHVDDDYYRDSYRSYRGVPESGSEFFSEKQTCDDHIKEELEPSSMPVAALKSELVERGYPVRGDRDSLISLLEEARRLKVREYVV